MPRANPQTHPRAYAFQSKRLVRRANGWLPDAVTDTNPKRIRKAAVLLGDGCGVLCRMWTLPGHELWHIVISLPDSLDFYAQAPTLGRAELRALFPDAPALAWAAYAHRRRSHLHVLVAIKKGEQLPSHGTFGRLFARRVKDAHHLEKLALYFSRPADERAARPNRAASLRHTREELETQRLDAAEMYLEARARLGRLPRTLWRQNIPRDLWEAPQHVPRRKPQLPSPRIPHRNRLPRWLTLQRAPQPRHGLRLFLPRTKHLPVPPRARGPPSESGPGGQTIPPTRQPEVRPMVHQFPPDIPATMGPPQETDYLLNTLRVYFPTRPVPLPPRLPCGGGGVRLSPWHELAHDRPWTALASSLSILPKVIHLGRAGPPGSRHS